MIQRTVSDSIKLFQEGTRVKGAWGLGTVTRGAWGASENPRKFYVSVRWDNGVVSQRQLIEALTVDFSYSGIPIAWCPECEIDEMIFYSEDYICAMCRERLER